MNEIEHYLDELRRELLYLGAWRRRRVLAEARDHLASAVEDGLTPAEAVARHGTPAATSSGFPTSRARRVWLLEGAFATCVALAALAIVFGSPFGGSSAKAATRIVPSSIVNIALPFDAPIVPLPKPIALEAAKLAAADNSCMGAHGAPVVRLNRSYVFAATEAKIDKARTACQAQERAGTAFEATPAYQHARKDAEARARLVWACIDRHGFVADLDISANFLATSNTDPATLPTVVKRCQADPAV